MHNDNLPLVFYGAGKNAQKTINNDSLSDYKPVCFCDVDKIKQGTSYMGLPVLSLEKVREKYGNDFNLYLTMTKPLKYHVVNYLLAAGITKKQIINFESYVQDFYVPLTNILNKTKEWASLIPPIDEFNEMGFTQNYKFLFETIEGEQIKTMMSIFETTYLYYIAKNEYTGSGAIVDLGPLGGMSTYSLLRGLKANPSIELNNGPYVFSFDLFLSSYYPDFIDSSMDSQTGSVFMKYLNTIKPYIDYLHITPGNLLNMSWCKKDIEILFIDICKTWETNDFVVKTFFPHLIPGKSIIIQQDYIYFGHHWIHLTMELLKDYFVIEEYVPYNSVVYKYVKQLPESILQFNLLSMYSKQELVEIHNEIVTNSPTEIRDVLALSHAFFLHELGHKQESEILYESVLERINEAIDFDSPYSYSISVNNVLQHYRSIIGL